MNPEDGRSAIAAASRAIADFRLGRIDEETSANVGVISGGTARNVVPEWCSFTAEVRSHDESKAVDLVREMLETRRVRREPRRMRGRERGAAELPGLPLPRERRAGAARRRRRSGAAGIEPTYALAGGGADANVFNARGLHVREPRERDDGDPHARRAHRGRRPRGDGRVTLALVDAAAATRPRLRSADLTPSS